MSASSDGPSFVIGPRLRRSIATALEEDAAATDPSAAAFPNGDRSEARLVAREPAVVAGQPVVTTVFDELDASVDYHPEVTDGRRVDAGARIGTLRGPTDRLLRGERTALNYLQRLCGVATETARYADALEGSGTKVVDTRKTLPGFRELDKYAVRCGGGANHRYNLSGGVIVKENHIEAAGGVREAVAAIRAETPHLVGIEVEVEELEALEAALDADADAVMLDNMATDRMERAIARVRERAGDTVTIEASGDITLDRLPELAELDLDLVSVGALTHSVDAIDISMLF